MEQCTVDSARGKWILFATILASGMAFLIGTAVSIALPTIQSDFGANISGMQWVVSAYVVVLASFLLLGGSLGDHFGRKRIFSYGIIIFLLGAALSGFAKTISALIAFQALEGLGAAMMIPGSLAIINVCFVESHRGQAIGLWAGLAGGVAALGPLLGGWLVETFGWQAIFYFNVPIGLIALFVTSRFVPESRNPEARKLDLLGTLCITLGLFGIAYGLIQGPVVGWNNPLVLISLIGGASALILFVIVELRVREPMVPLKIFKNPLVAGANLVTFLLYFALNGLIFFLVFNLQQVQEYSPIFAGLALLPPIILITFLSGPAGSLADKIGPRLQMILGPLIVAFGMALLIIPGVHTNYYIHFLPGLILFGGGMALVIAPLTKSALAVEQKFSGAASGVNNTASRVAALLAIAVLGAVMTSIFTNRLSVAAQTSSLSSEEKLQILSQANKLGGIEIPDVFGEEPRVIAESAVKESFVHGFRWIMGINALLALLSALIAAITIRNPTRPRKYTA